MTLSRAALCAWAFALHGCGATLPPLVLPHDKPIVLLGEVHDNAAGHALRLRALDALLERGARPALLMEQLDRGLQPRIDELRQRMPRPRAAAFLAELPAPRGWDWRFYEPFVERAFEHGLPIVAANVGRDEARNIVREGLAAHGFEPAVPEAVLATLARRIEASHCGQVDAAQARRLALAQVARDQQMARALAAQGARGAVLLAGNEHVRNDIGAPRWLDASTRTRSVSVGVVEASADDTPDDAFDQRVTVPRQARPDPCAAMVPARSGVRAP
jgi:uncharacterized iron-regulated protein